MKICYSISSVDENSGGTSTYLRLLTASLLNHDNLSLYVLAYTTSTPTKLDSRINLRLLERNRLYLISNCSVSNCLKSLNCDLYHINGLWQSMVRKTAGYAIKNKIPYIVSPHGMLEPWSLEQGKFKKRLALKSFQFQHLKRAICIHATATMEVNNLRKLGLKNPIAMIPNGVDLSMFPSFYPEKSIHPKKILFLSRIHVKKGLENLIEAWKLINPEIRENWKIEVVGNGDENYIKSLKDKIISEKLTAQIEIKLPVFGVEKVKIFREASLFVLPSYSENFGIVIAEALASYTPVITTKGTPWNELNTYNSGWWIDIAVEPLRAALHNAMQTADSDLKIMSKNGRKLVEDKYSMEAVSGQMLELYQWVLNKRLKPVFVDIL
jgi:glycosyltransferase involved in cell wall biosynthesis